VSKGQKLDFGLKFLHQAMKLESLHFGMFTDGIPHDLDGIKLAQREYTKVLVGMIPKGTKSVLDVGCGVGTSCRVMKDEGFDVEGLSPDNYHKDVFPQICGTDVLFHHSGFEPFTASKKYDCLFFSESPQYIKKDEFWPKCLDLTEKGSSVVAADFFQKVKNEEYHMCFLEEDFVKRAERAGYKVEEHKDITKQVLPNVEISQMLLGHGQTFMEFIQDAIRIQAPVVWKIIKLLFGRKMKTINSLVYDKLPNRLDPERFQKTMSYAMYRFSR
jgi:MPBQ/MSBQ methyltransferase